MRPGARATEPTDGRKGRRISRPAAAASPAAVGDVSGDLLTDVGAFVSAIPRAGSGAYHVPSASEVAAMVRAFDAIEAGRLVDAASLAAPLGYEVARYEDAATGGALVVVLSEKRGPEGSRSRAWGMYVHAPGATSELAVEVVHPIADSRTEHVGVEVFRKTGARDLFVAGAHRAANADGAADVAHAAVSVFEGIHRAVAASRARVFQPHGFSREKHPDHGEVVVSAGIPMSRLALEAHQALNGAGFDARLYDGSSCRSLAGTKNAQGASARAAGADFLHVEAARSVRDDALRRERFTDTLANVLRQGR